MTDVSLYRTGSRSYVNSTLHGILLIVILEIRNITFGDSSFESIESNYQNLAGQSVDGVSGSHSTRDTYWETGRPKIKGVKH